MILKSLFKHIQVLTPFTIDMKHKSALATSILKSKSEKPGFVHKSPIMFRNLSILNLVISRLNYMIRYIIVEFPCLLFSDFNQLMRKRSGGRLWLLK
jgi:hypothetical protein